MENLFLFGLAVRNFLWILSGYLSVCMQKDMSGWQLFMGNFDAQLGLAALKNKVKITLLRENTY